MISKYDVWLQSAPDNSFEDEYIESRTQELLKEKEYDPSDTSHMAEAIAECSEADQQIIRDYIEQKKWAELGLKLFCKSFDYMEHFAEAQAEHEVQQGLHI
jgi:hypothetical protein